MIDRPIDLATVEGLLNRVDLTGSELGLLSLYSAADVFRQQRLSDDRPVPLMSTEYFNLVYSRLSQEEQTVYWKDSASVLDWIMDCRAEAMVRERDMTLRFQLMASALEDAITAEQVLDFYSSAPRVILKPGEDTTRGRMEAQEHGMVFLLQEGEQDIYRAVSPEAEKRMGLKSVASYEYGYASDRLSDYRECFMDSYYFIEGYNISLELIAKRTGCSNITEMRVELTKVSRNLKFFHRRIDILRGLIESASYSDAEKHKRLYLLEKHFKKINLRRIRPSSEYISDAAEIMATSPAFVVYGDELRRLLLLRSAE